MNQTTTRSLPTASPRWRHGACLLCWRSLGTAVAAVLFLGGPAVGQAGHAFGGYWQPQGPGPIQGAQVENIVPDDEAVGAIHALAPHPTDPDTLFVGAVNGGIWRTRDATALQPSWNQQTDLEGSLSIGSIKFDPTDSQHRTLVAGIGLFSSYARIGGARTGLLRTTNLGNKWKTIDGGGILVDKNIASVEARGDTLVIAVDFADPFTFSNIGIWRSTDGGESFTQIAVEDGGDTGLPGGVTFDLVGDPNDPDRLFTSVVFADSVGGANGVYRSDDTGATWTKVSSPEMDALLISGDTSNVEFAVGRHDNVYAAIANLGRLAGLFRSDDGGDTWTALDLPTTVESGGAVFGIHPGGQASIHMSLAADPDDPNILYIGGDRQPFFTEGGGPGDSFPNSIGANDFSGRLFRVDASQPPGSQAVHLTHSDSLGAPGGGTASSSSPHADSREMAVDGAGDLLEVDDGGVYRRTSPQTNTGDWFSINGDIQTNEQHDTAYDSLSRIVFSGNQDNGTTMQNLPDDATWTALITADGGDVTVDDSDPEVSIRFSSFQVLQAFNRSFWDAENTFLAIDFPDLTVIGGGAPFEPQFTTPVEANVADPQRLIFGGANSIYESLDQGFTLSEIGPGLPVVGLGRNPIAYGVPDDPDILWIGSEDRMYSRIGPPGTPLVQSTAFPGTGSGLSIRGVAIDPNEPSMVFVANATNVFMTSDAGASWTDITGDLGPHLVAPINAVAFIPRMGNGDHDVLVVGGSNGAFHAREQHGFNRWKPLGTGLPTVPVFDLKYDMEMRLLVAGTLGRGAWKLNVH